MPTECEHGRIVDWGDFGGDDYPKPCPDCEREREARNLALSDPTTDVDESRTRTLREWAEQKLAGRYGAPSQDMRALCSDLISNEGYISKLRDVIAKATP